MSTVAGGEREEAVLAFVRQLVAEGKPFTIGIDDAPGGLEDLNVLRADRVFSEVTAGECKRWAWVPGVGLVCIEH